MDDDVLHEAGFVSHVVARDELDEFTTELATQIARHPFEPTEAGPNRLA